MASLLPGLPSLDIKTTTLEGKELLSLPNGVTLRRRARGTYQPPRPPPPPACQPPPFFRVLFRAEQAAGSLFENNHRPLIKWLEPETAFLLVSEPWGQAWHRGARAVTLFFYPAPASPICNIMELFSWSSLHRFERWSTPVDCFASPAFFSLGQIDTAVLFLRYVQGALAPGPTNSSPAAS